MPGRPLWRRTAGWIRRAFWRLTTPVDRLLRRGSALLPPAHLRIYYYGTRNPERFAQACDTVRAELIARGLKPEHRVLEIGSGIGNLALGLADYLHGGYDGLEIHPEAVSWCQRAITPRHPGFRFHRADVSNRAYNPTGQVAASAYRFPFPDATFDFVFAASVFTHMLPEEVESYLREISRVLAPDGACVASYFLLNDTARPDVIAGKSFMSFAVEHPSGLCRLHDATVPEAAVALEESFVRRAHEQSGLQIQGVHRGGWWKGEAHHQDILMATRATPAIPGLQSI